MVPQDCENLLFYATIPKIYLKNGFLNGKAKKARQTASQRWVSRAT